MQRRRSRYALTAAGLALGIAALVSSPARASESVYRYVDERGVVHLTDVPADGRYQPVRITPRGLHMGSKRRSDPNAYDDLIAHAARRHRVPPAMVKAVVRVESAFDPLAISRKGAMGLMQLMPNTARGLGVRDAFHVEQNIAGGTRYLRRMADRYSNWILALAAYNAGPRAVDRYGGVPPYRETRRYVRKVLHYYRAYYDEFPR